MHRSFVIIFLLLTSLGLQAQDSVDYRGFWQRYSRPRRVAVDSAARARQARREARRVSFAYDVDFATYFDNREYHEPYQRPQTIFNFRLAPELGVRINDPAGGVHEVMAGVAYTQPLGGNWADARFDPTAYYRYRYRGASLELGAIPFNHRLHALPDWLMYDSLSYIRPNIQGALISYSDRRGYVELMCDWRGSQTVTRREKFRLTVDGRWQYRWFNLGGMAQINHKARFREPAPWEGVADDIYVSPQIGFDFGRLLPALDSFSLRLGYVVGIENDRAANLSYMPQGFTAELYLNWWFLGVKDQLYVGDPLMPLYHKYASELNQGDPFYQGRIYNRLDIFAYIYRNSFVNCYFSYNMHYNGRTLQHQQQLIVRFLLSGLNHKQPLRNLFDK